LHVADVFYHVGKAADVSDVFGWALVLLDLFYELVLILLRRLQRIHLLQKLNIRLHACRSRNISLFINKPQTQRFTSIR